MRGAEGNRRSFERDRVLFEVDLDKTDEGVDTGSETTVPDGVVKKGLHHGCFEGGSVYFSEACSHEVSEGRKM